MHKGQPIVFFDSGLGGISVLADALAFMPHEHYVYFGDSANAPYGTKNDAVVLRLTLESVEKLDGIGIKALVVACNTATGIAANALRKKYPFPVIGMEPALKAAFHLRQRGLILVMATPLTLLSAKYKALYAQYGENAVNLPCPGLMDFVEREELDSPALDAYLQTLFSQFRDQEIDSVVLGCTHYLFIQSAIAKNLPLSTRIINGNRGTVNQLRRRLAQMDLLADNQVSGGVQLLSSGGAGKVSQMERMLRLMQSRSGSE